MKDGVSVRAHAKVNPALRVLGQRADALADWYAWGTVLFELLEGHPPYRLDEVVAIVRGDEVPSPRVDSQRFGDLRLPNSDLFRHTVHEVPPFNLDCNA